MKSKYFAMALLLGGTVSCGSKSKDDETVTPTSTPKPAENKPTTTTTTTTTTTPAKPAVDLNTPVTSTLSFSQPQKSTALMLAPPQLPYSCSAYRLKVDGTWETKADASNFKIDAKGKVALTLKPGTFAVRCKDTANGAEGDYSVFDVTAKKNAEATPLVAKKPSDKTPPKANLVTIRKNPNAAALAAAAAKAQAKSKTPEAIKKQQDLTGKLVDTKAAVKQGQAIDKADKKANKAPEKKSDKTVDGIGKALANAGDKGDAEKQKKTKEAMTKKNEKKAAALGLQEVAAVTDEDVEAAIAQLEADLEACMAEPLNVLKFTSADGVDDGKLEKKCVKDLKAGTDDQDLVGLWDVIAADDPIAAELQALPADERPDDVDVASLAAEAALDDAMDLLFESSVFEELASDENMDDLATLLAVTLLSADSLTEAQLTELITQLDADSIDDTVAASNPLLGLFNQFESGASRTEIMAVVNQVAANFNAEELAALKLEVKEGLEEEAAAAADAEAIAAEDDAAADNPVGEDDGDGDGDGDGDDDTQTEEPAVELR